LAEADVMQCGWITSKTWEALSAIGYDHDAISTLERVLRERHEIERISYPRT
jgi:hypothetical protein